MSEISELNSENKEVKASEIDEIKPITIRFKDRDNSYTLEFSRATVKMAEREGFVMDIFSDESHILDYPVTNIEKLFYYSFQMHHRGIQKSVTDKILYDELNGISSAMVQRLFALYSKATTTLLNDDDEARKNSVAYVEM